jgi:thymidylate kinase
MKNILEINCILANDYKATLHGDVKHAPGDVDYYINSQLIAKAVEFLIDNGFVLTNLNKKFNHYVLRRFEKYGNLYILDLMSNLNIMLEPVPYLILSKEGSEYVGSNKTVFRKLHALVKQEASHEKIKQLLPSIFNHKSFIEVGRNRFLNIINIRWFYFEMKLLRYLNRFYSGKRVAFVGPDGSGKTFIIEKISKIGRTENIYMGDWFFYFQEFYNQIKIKIPTPYNRFVYAFYPPEQYYRVLKTYIWKARGRIVLIDRIPGLNKNISKKGALGWLNKLTFFMYPKPDIIFHLYAPAEVIYKRKKELSVDEIATANHHLEQKIGKKKVTVNTVDLDDALNKILKYIYKD